MTHSTEPSISWNDFTLRGDARSIAEVRRLLTAEARLRRFEGAYREIAARHPGRGENSVVDFIETKEPA